MSIIENDPRTTGYAALLVAITWFQDLSSEQALRVVSGQSHRKPGQKLTPELFKEIKKILDSPNYSNINSVVRRFRVNKYDIYAAIEQDKRDGKIANEEVVLMPKIEFELKKLSSKANDCPGANCDSCALNTIAYGENTLCEIICDLKFDDNGKLEKGENKEVHKSAQKCTIEMLTGETERKGFEVYKSILDAFEQYVGQHKEKKKRDITSAALFEYMARQKRT